MHRFIASTRAYLGGIALGLGSIGMLLFALGMLANAVITTFFPAVDDHAASQLFSDRLLLLFVISLGLIGYGFYEAANEKNDRAG